jgi:hypothetical protein
MLAKLDLKEYARLGAQARVDQLHAELADIYRAFPGLRARRGRGAAARSATVAGDTAAPRRRKRTMTAAQKREVSQRMKRYWAARRKEKQDGRKG